MADKCIVHYEKQTNYRSIKKLSETNIQRIQEAKLKRAEIGGVHLHKEQSDGIPDVIDAEKFGVHLEPCYKR